MTRVLFVDDEDALVFAIVRQAARHRPAWVFEGTTDSADALQRIQTAAPDVLVTDLRMPGLDGLQLLVAARTAAPGLPAVVVTAYGSAELRAELARHGSVEYLEKPFNVDQLFGAIDRASGVRSGFSGAVAQLTLADIVQLHALAQFSGRIDVSHGQQRAAIWFTDGQVSHAEYGALSGREALLTILAWREGTFAAHQRERGPTTIGAPWQELLMEACRRIDEAYLFGGDPGADGLAATTGHDAAAAAGGGSPLARLATVPGVLAACTVELDSGQVLDELRVAEAFDIVAVAGHQCESFRLAEAALAECCPGQRLEEALTTSTAELHLMRRTAAASCLLVCAERALSNAALLGRAAAELSWDHAARP